MYDCTVTKTKCSRTDGLHIFLPMVLRVQGFSTWSYAIKSRSLPMYVNDNNGDSDDGNDNTCNKL